MLLTKSFEKMAISVGTLSKSQVKRHLLNFHGGTKLDFTESYLDSLRLDKLRHILLAALETRARR